ncbi:Hypothetical protein NocV09_01601310 [Nannochloropsis oceanica]
MPIPPSLTAPPSYPTSVFILLALLFTLTTTLTNAFLPPSSAPTSLSSSRTAAVHLTRRSAAFIELGEKTRGGGGSDEEGGTGGGGGGGRATVITERAWNTSTLGALPANMDILSKSICDCALTAIANGEMGLTVHAGGEFDARNKYHDPYQLTSLVVGMAAKLSVLGPTRVLFAGPEALETSLNHMRQLIQLEAKKEQEELATIKQVRRQVQAKFPGTKLPEIPSEMAKEKMARNRERQRLAERVRFGSLLGSYRLTGDSVTDLETAPSMVFGEVDLEEDRLFIVVVPGNSPVEALAVRKLIRASHQGQPILVLNHLFDPEPLEMSIFTAAYHLDICKLKRLRPPPSLPLPSDLSSSFPPPPTPTEQAQEEKEGGANPSSSPPSSLTSRGLEEIETVLVRKFPNPWQLYGAFEVTMSLSGLTP